MRSHLRLGLVLQRCGVDEHQGVRGTTQTYEEFVRQGVQDVAMHRAKGAELLGARDHIGQLLDLQGAMAV